MKLRLASTLSRFIRFNTVTTQSNARFARYLARILKKQGFRVSLQSTFINHSKFVNVLAQKGPRGRALMLCAHSDTVPSGEVAQWTKTNQNPWKAKRVGSWIYGLGSADDKGPLVAMMEACFVYPVEQLQRPLLLAVTFGEESGMKGAKLLIRKWKQSKPVAVVVAEPTSLGVTYRHKGLGVIEITIRHPKITIPKNSKVIQLKGKQAHSSRPHTGDNALVRAMNYVRRHAGVYLDIRAGHAANIIPGKASITIAKDKVKSHYPLQEVMACFDSVQEIVRSYSSKKDNSFFPPTLTSNFGILKTKGTQTHLVFDFRLLPGQSIFKIERVLRKKIALKLKNHASKWMLRVDRQDAPLGLTASHRYVRSHRQLLKENGLALRLSSKPSCTEAGTYEAWGVPAVVFGPGAAQGNIHAPNEKINMQEIEKAISYYTSCIDEFAGKSS